METDLLDVDNNTLRKEYEFFVSISCKSGNSQSRETYLQELEKEFNASDKNHDGTINRKEFERLIKGYFELKGIKATKENFDEYFEKLDINHDQSLTFEEYLNFMDQVNDHDIIPFLAQEMEDRGLF